MDNSKFSVSLKIIEDIPNINWIMVYIFKINISFSKLYFIIWLDSLLKYRIYNIVSGDSL